MTRDPPQTNLIRGTDHCRRRVSGGIVIACSQMVMIQRDEEHPVFEVALRVSAGMKSARASKPPAAHAAGYSPERPLHRGRRRGRLRPAHRLGNVGRVLGLAALL